MDTVGTVVSWVQEAWKTASRLPFEPGFWAALFAALVLAYLVSIARSLGRLRRRLSSAVAELEEIRSALKGIERTLERSRANDAPADREIRDIRDLPLRERKERP